MMEGGNGLDPFEGLDAWGEETDVSRRDAALAAWYLDAFDAIRGAAAEGGPDDAQGR